MASFAVDITSVRFAATNTGYKDITIIGRPQAIIGSIIGADVSSFGFRISSDDDNVYRVYTTSHTNIGSTSALNKTATFRITNAADSTDYVDVSLEQVSYFGYPVVRGVENVYDNIYAYYRSDTYPDSYIFAEYRTDNVGTYAILYVDGYEGTTTLSQSWAYYTAESAYTDTGFKQIKIGATNNYDAAFRSCTITFPGTSTSSNSHILYQNAYPSNTAGCTSPTLFTKDGGTNDVYTYHSTGPTVSNFSYENYTNDGLTYTISKTAVVQTEQPRYRIKWGVTVGPNSTDNILRGALLFYRPSTNDILGFTLVRQDAASGPAQTLTADPALLNYPASGGGKTLDVTYATSLSTNESSFPDWLSSTYVSVGSSARSYTITAASNTSTSSRSFDFELADANMSLVVPITQAGGSAASLSISPSSKVFDYVNGNVDVNVYNAVGNITTAVSGSWLSVGSPTVSGSYTIYPVNAASNSSDFPRYGGVVTFADDRNVPVTFTANQYTSRSDSYIEASPREFYVSSSGDTVNVNFISFVNIVNYNSGPDWVHPDTYPYASGNSLIWPMTIDPNNTGSYREENVWFGDRYTSYGVLVKQPAGTVSPSLTVSPSSMNVSNNSGQVSVTVTVNNPTSGSVSCSISGSWLTESTQSCNTYYFNYSANTGAGTRTAIVTFSYPGASNVTFTVTQAGVSPGPTPAETGSLKAYPKKLRYYKEGGSINVSFTNRPAAGIGYQIIYTDGSGWLTVSGNSVTAAANSGIRRRASIKFYDLGDSNNYVIIPVIQGSVDGYDSIWVDQMFYPEDRDENGNYYYRLVNQDEGFEYFVGVSTTPEGFGNFGIDIPRLVEGHLHNYFTARGTGLGWNDMQLAYATVDVYNMTDSGWPGVVDDTFKYCNDWSRIEKRYDYTKSLNDPINFKGMDNMVIPFCVYYDDAATFSAVETERNGNVNTYTYTTPENPFSMRYDMYYDTKRVDYMQDGDILFSYDLDHCGPGALIYRNRFGGWDSFLIEGNVIKTDNYTRQNWRRKGFYNQTIDVDSYGYNAAEKVTDSIDINTTYEAHTGWLTDEESARLVFHLLSSPTVYYQILKPEETNTDAQLFMFPVRLTTSSAEYKKFRNGKRLVNYLITFEKGNIEKVMR